MADHVADGIPRALPRLADLVASTDWSRTALGPSDDWSQALSTIVGTCLGSRFPVMVFWGPDLVQIYNDAYAPLIGAKHPAALGQTAQECFPEIWDAIGPMLAGVMADGDATWSDDLMLFLQRDGFAEECYFTFSFGPAGRAPVAGVFCTAIETTRQVIEERRQALLRDVATSLAGLSSAELVFDTAVAVLKQHQHDILGGRLRVLDGAEKVRDIPWPEGTLSGAEKDLDRLTAAVLRDGRIHIASSLDASSLDASSLDASGLDAGGSYRPGEPTVCVAPIVQPGADGPVAVLAVDINEHIRFDLAFEEFITRIATTISAAHAIAEGFEASARRAAALEEIDAAKTAFLSNVSHEFRTPLTLLLAPIEEYQNDLRVPAEVRAGLAMAERNGRRVLKLVNSLLDMSRLEAGRVTATFQPTDLAALTIELASLFDGAAQAARIELIVDCDDLGELVHIDREMWEQIVTNLCANAFKFTSHGSVTVHLFRGAGCVRLEVTDTGTGILPADLPYIFDRFRRGQTSGAHAGTGLGLALVQEFVGLHGGTIDVTSTWGSGSTFTVTIPSGTAHLDPARLISESAVAPRALSTSWSEIVPTGSDDGNAEDLPTGSANHRPIAGPDATVWVVEDNADMRRYLSRLLRPYWTVETFPDAESATDAMSNGLPHLVLSDVMLPGRSGLDLLGVLRTNPVTADIPVILLSARAGEEATVEGLGAGADDYLTKPFTARDLLSRVASNLSLAGLRRDIGARALRHAARLGDLAAASIRIVSADTFQDIVSTIERTARDVTGAASCQVTVDADLATGVFTPTVNPGDGRIIVAIHRGDSTPLGQIVLTFPPGIDLDAEDITLVEQLALVASHRIEHLARYRHEHRISHTLQRSLLPAALPSVPGAEIAARYRPATATEDVGGDWYDALVLPDGRLMISVGDVMGHDLAAAVTMSQIRLLLRARAADAGSPAALCDIVNQLLPIVGTTTMATMILAFIDLTTGRTDIVNAGHPPAVIAVPGDAAIVPSTPSIPLGILPGASYQQITTMLPIGSTLLLYTDGLIERRDEAPEESRDKLLRRLADIDDSALESFTDAVLDAAAIDASDDIAVLAVRRLR